MAQSNEPPPLTGGLETSASHTTVPRDTGNVRFLTSGPTVPLCQVDDLVVLRIKNCFLLQATLYRKWLNSEMSRGQAGDKQGPAGDF